MKLTKKSKKGFQWVFPELRFAFCKLVQMFLSVGFVETANDEPDKVVCGERWRDGNGSTEQAGQGERFHLSF
ncbi:hypothetical protein ES332_A04G111000v1 [Gossypium tomentosum]|uniref:Uncharacterized protein n=1 Tax=Gossypium tomentosum TaxID=34277 RepID=A0A5D2R0W5_GOSTO|nr:hypothetical protein ES332_A04G111000v1 [Gossypium tomentosum]